MPPAIEPATALQPEWLEGLPIWLQHRNKLPCYTGRNIPKPRSGELDRDEDRAKLVSFAQLALAPGFEPGYALGPVNVGGVVVSLCGTDLDDCFEADGMVRKDLRPFCQAMHKAGAMIEVSRSGCGLHLVWLAQPGREPPTFKHPGVECYAGRRFFARGSRLLHHGSGRMLDVMECFRLLPDGPAEPVQPPGETETIPLVEGDGRNHFLFGRLVALRQNGLRGEALCDAVRSINDRLQEPLSAEELEATVLHKGGERVRAPVHPTAHEEFSAVEAAERKHLGKPLGDDAEFNFTVVEYLIDDVLPAGGLTMLWGESTAGKSFLAIDWALHLVYGRVWHGHEVAAGTVLYLASEGEIGLMKRVVAWRRFHAMSEPTGARFAVQALPYVMPLEMLKLDELKVDRADLIVIDTLNGWSVGDENKADEMGEWLRIAKELSKRAGGAAVVIVHHARKEGDLYRGSTALKAAMDAEFEIVGDRASVTITQHKSKDAAPIEPLRLMKRTVDLGSRRNRLGSLKAHDSLVFDAPVRTEQVEVSTSLEHRIVEALRQCGGEVSSRNNLLQLVRGMREPTLAVVRTMLASGSLVSVGRYGLRLIEPVSEFGPVIEENIFK